MNKANLKGNLRKPFLRLKWRIKERAKIKDAYFSVRSIKEILAKEREIYQDILKEERNPMKKEKVINELEGFNKCISWLFSDGE